MADSAAFASVKIEGIETISNVESVDVEDNDRLIDRATVVYADTDGIAAATLQEGRKVVIELGWTCDHARLFEGIVLSVKTQAKVDGSGPKQRVTLVALDLSYKLNQGVGKAKQHSGKLSEILKAIVTPYQIPIGQIKTETDPEFKDQPLLQAPMTDWAFIQELATRYGARAFVEVNDDKSQFYFISEKAFREGDSLGTLNYKPGTGPLMKFTYQRLASAAAPVRSITVTDPLTGIPALKQGTAPSPEAPLATDPDQKSRLDKLGTGAGKVYSDAVDVMSKSADKTEDARPKQNVAGLPSDPDLADNTILQDPTRKWGMIGKGELIGNINIRAKGKVTMAGDIPPWTAGDWYVRRVDHLFRRGGGSNHQDKAAVTYTTKMIMTR